MKQKRPYSEAQASATGIVNWLQPFCERIEIAGSIRRKCESVGDIEIVAIPEPVVNLFGERTDKYTVNGILHMDSSVQMRKDGNRYKQFIIEIDGEPWQVDLFLATPDNFGYILMLRTGSADFSRRMVTLKLEGGYKPATVKVEDGRVWHNGARIAIPDEHTLFSLWDMDYIEPEMRK